MNNRERFQRVLNFQPVDRLPMIEWAGWWTLTRDRWLNEGLPKDLGGDAEIREYFGQDAHRQSWIGTRNRDCPAPKSHGAALVSNRAEYLEIKKYLYPDEAINKEMFASWAEAQNRGELVIWITLDGPFWFPRKLFGIVDHLLAFYDQPELMMEMNEDLLAYNLRVLEQVYEICTPDFMTIAEDMSYNHGPMISKAQFDEFMAPFYRRITPVLLEKGTVPFVDSDGDVSELIGWFMDVGIQGFLPLERMAGVDVAELRRRYPTLRMIGAYDKQIMHLGEARMREEFERLLPVMRQGGFIASVDHQTPPEVSLDQYRIWMRLLQEYCEKAAG